MNRVLPICVLVTVLITGWLYAQPAQIRVRLFSVEQPSEVRITTPDGQAVLLDAGKDARKDTGKIFRSEGPVTILRAGGEGVRVPYPIEVSARKGALVIITELPLEDYVAAVLAGESSGFRAEESLKAMAVAARTWAVHFLNRHKTEGFDFCDTTHCQDFRVTALRIVFEKPSKPRATKCFDMTDARYRPITIRTAAASRSRERLTWGSCAIPFVFREARRSGRPNSQVPICGRRLV